MLMVSNVADERLTTTHRAKLAYIYVRQSSVHQVRQHQESTELQYRLVDRAVRLGWPHERVQVIDEDLGKSGAGGVERQGFQKLIAEIGLGNAGLVISLDASRLARNNRDWHQLLELCSVFGVLIADGERLYDPRAYHDRLLLGLSGIMSEAELHQEETPTFRLESWTRFKMVAPHYIDVTFRCKPYQHVFKYGYIGLFWASYIDNPENKSIYFRDDKGWVQLCTQTHSNQSTVVPVGNKIELKFTPETREMLYKNFSPLRFSDPFYYGLFGTHQYILMFDRTDGIRFAHSPSAGGPPSATEVAWDWQFIIPTYDVLREYGYRARVVYRERCSRAEVLKEFRTWKAALQKEPR